MIKARFTEPVLKYKVYVYSVQNWGNAATSVLKYKVYVYSAQNWGKAQF